MTEPVLEVRNLRTHFALPRPHPFRQRAVLKAVDGVSFRIGPGDVLGLVGESGCGKSTVGRTLTRLVPATSGSVLLEGIDVLKLSPSAFRPLRARIQMIFQDPFASLNPRLTVEQTLSEPLRIHGLARTSAEARARIAEMLVQVGLDPDAMRRYPFEFSGGQRQRIGIARVMIVSPTLVIADEPVSALDVSIQAQVLNLIRNLLVDRGISMLFISHDLGVVRHVSNRVAVMYLGQIIECGSKSDIFRRPGHPYTHLLLSSVLRADPARRRARPKITGEPASAANPPQGCAFHPRCPLATEVCRRFSPPVVSLGNGHHAACHHASSESASP